MMNRGYSYGQTSEERILTTKILMQELCSRALVIANRRKLHCPDISITDALRTAEEQNDMWAIGRKLVGPNPKERDHWIVIGKTVTNCDGYIIKSAHQSGLAIDFCAWVDGAANYEPSNLALIATCFFEAASDMGIDIDWGGSFRSISDAPHVEIRL